MVRGIITKLYDDFEKSPLTQAIRNGFVSIIPVLMLGAFSLMLMHLPIKGYQSFITTAFSGLLFRLFRILNSATSGMLSVHLTFAISLSYARARKKRKLPMVGAPVCALIAFGILTGFSQEGFSLEYLGAKGMFTAMIASVFASAAYFAIGDWVRKRSRRIIGGIDSEVSRSLATLPIILVVSMACAVVNQNVASFTGAYSFNALISQMIIRPFNNAEHSLGSTLALVAMISFLWLFGIHGNDVMEIATLELLDAASAVNAERVAAGLEPTEIFNRSMVDIFVLMGGCGTGLCLLLAVLIFSRDRVNRNIGWLSAIPAIFNINEPLVFGLPVVFNPYMFVPFIAVPAVMVLNTFIAMKTGLVAIAMPGVHWTTPVLLSGYQATGSIRGLLLQLFNIVVGTAIYAPFVRMYDNHRKRQLMHGYNWLVDTMKEAEAASSEISLTTLPSDRGQIARSISYDIKRAISNDTMELYYQPQYDYKGQLIGAEALVRMKHPSVGMIYPPMVIEIAKEDNQLAELERYILEKAAESYSKFREKYGSFKLCVNITPYTLKQSGSEKFLRSLNEKYDLPAGAITLEITEQMSMDFTSDTQDSLARLREMGYQMAIDDFSMGFTSLKYLQSNHFDLVKLDGSLVRSMESNERSTEIISSIVDLAQRLNFNVLAEYVETQEQRESLAKIGCKKYQGYLFGKAMPMESFFEANKSINAAQ